LTYLERQKSCGSDKLRWEEAEEKIRLKQYVFLRSKGRHNYTSNKAYVFLILFRCFNVFFSTYVHVYIVIFLFLFKCTGVHVWNVIQSNLVISNLDKWFPWIPSSLFIVAFSLFYMEIHTIRYRPVLREIESSHLL
jgi:hypothetical protein